MIDRRLRDLRSGRALVGLPAIAITAAVLFMLIVLPNGILFYGAFSTSAPGAFELGLSQLSLTPLLEVLGSGALQRSALVTLRVVVLGVAIAVAVAGVLAWLVARTNVPFRRLIAAAGMAPLFVSPLVAAIAWSALGSPYSGLVNLLLRDLGIDVVLNIQSEIGLAWVMGTSYAPYAYLLILGSLQGIDATAEEAGNICGANHWQTFRRVTFGLIRPALLAAMLLVGVTLAGIYAIPAIIGEPGGVLVIATYIGRLVLRNNPDYQAAAVIGVILAFITTVLVVAQNWLLRRRQYATMTGKTQRRRRVDLKTARYPVAAMVLCYLMLTVVLPVAALVLTAARTSPFYASFRDAFNPEKFAMQNFLRLTTDPLLSRSITNSIVVALLTAVVGVTLSFAISYIHRRTDYPGGSLLDAVAMVPVAVPGLIIGLGFLWAWISLPVGIYGTLLILVAAFVAHQVPTGVRSIDTTLMQVHPELEEAAASCGAGRLQRIRSIIIPLTHRGILASATLFFVFAVREVGSILFLYNSRTTVMSVQVLDTWNRGAVGAAAALAVVQAVIVALVVAMSRALRKEDAL